MRKRRRNRRILTIVLLLTMVALAVVAIRSGHEIVTRLDEYQAATREYADLREQVKTQNDTADTASETGGIDFEALRAINSNVVGWIVVPGTDISYPIVQGTDNDHYLRRTFAGEQNSSGTIFMDYRNSADFSDRQTILYGHNMRDGSMFAPLHGWTGDHFVIHTPDGVLEFGVFHRQTVVATHEIYQLHDTEDGMRTVTLSTCVSGQRNMRYIVQGR